VAQSFAADPGRIAVVGGTGPEGSGLASRWVQAGLDVVIGSRQAPRAEETADTIRGRVGDGAKATGAANVDAVAMAETVVLCVPFQAQLDTLKSISASLRPGQVLVDCTVPLAAAVGGRPTAMLGVWQGSAAQQAATAVPRGVSVVGAFHNVSAHHLGDLSHPVECDVLVCGDNGEAKHRVRRLVEAIAGCRYVDAGPIANARIVESLTALVIGLNIRYKVPGAGIRITGLFPDTAESSRGPA
jgi:8-hydroxy-5-deazaflavin:NADPH oxidoreductase